MLQASSEVGIVEGVPSPSFLPAGIELKDWDIYPGYIGYTVDNI